MGDTISLLDVWDNTGLGTPNRHVVYVPDEGGTFSASHYTAFKKMGYNRNMEPKGSIRGYWWKDTSGIVSLAVYPTDTGHMPPMGSIDGLKSVVSDVAGDSPEEVLLIEEGINLSVLASQGVSIVEFVCEAIAHNEMTTDELVDQLLKG